MVCQNWSVSKFYQGVFKISLLISVIKLDFIAMFSQVEQPVSKLLWLMGWWQDSRRFLEVLGEDLFLPCVILTCQELTQWSGWSHYNNEDTSHLQRAGTTESGKSVWIPVPPTYYLCDLGLNIEFLGFNFLICTRKKKRKNIYMIDM